MSSRAHAIREQVILDTLLKASRLFTIENVQHNKEEEVEDKNEMELLHNSVKEKIVQEKMKKCMALFETKNRMKRFVEAKKRTLAYKKEQFEEVCESRADCKYQIQNFLKYLIFMTCTIWNS